MMNLKKLLIIPLGLITFFILLKGFNTLLRLSETPAPSNLPQKPRILVFYEEGWGGIYAGSWSRLNEVKEKVAIVSPVWLGLKADGRVNWDKTDSATVKFLKENNLQFLVLVTAGSGKNASSILTDPDYHSNALNSIAAYLQRVDAAGVCLDFEYLNPVLREEFVKFVAELKESLAGKKLFVAVFPYVDWAEPSKEVYDYQRLGQICDGVVVMTYDQHRPGDPPGPVAALPWVNANLNYFLTQIDAKKLWLGIAGYGYRWRTDQKRATALPAWYCRKKALQKGSGDTYRPEQGNDYLEYWEAGVRHQIWWESSRGMKEKLELAAENRLAGVALWRLGYEEEEFWNDL
ncbi:MAG: hypothetical protein GX075_13990 [Firmicutes bacterium]|nr:hypothetical protein [Bacillota bacterium]